MPVVRTANEESDVSLRVERQPRSFSRAGNPSLATVEHESSKEAGEFVVRV